MTSLGYDIREKLSRLNVFEKIIVANVVLFLIGLLIKIFRKLPYDYGLRWLELPRDFLTLLSSPGL